MSDPIEQVLADELPEFARAVRAIVTGDAADLKQVLIDAPTLVNVRSTAEHGATLLHYVAANGIDMALQRPVPNADEIATLLLDAGAEPDATCTMYGGRPTTLDLVASSDHPCEAGVTEKLVSVLCDRGAAVGGPDGDGRPLATALCFGMLDAVRPLLAQGARTDHHIFAAAANEWDWLLHWYEHGYEGFDDHADAPGLPPAASGRVAEQQALVFASMCGQVETMEIVLESFRVDVNAMPPGSHWTATPLHTAAIQGQIAAVRFLLENGADVAARDPHHGATPLEWTEHGRGPRRAEIREVRQLLLDPPTP